MTARRIGIVALGALILAATAYFTVLGAAAPMGAITVPAGAASIAASDQSGVTVGITVDRVVAPEPALLVVSAEVTSGAYTATTAVVRVGKGVTTGLPILLYGTGVMPAEMVPRHVRLTLVADRGRPGVLEQDARDPAASIDKPFLVDGKPVTAVVALRAYGLEVAPGTAAIRRARLTRGGHAVSIDEVVAPEESAVVITAGGAQFSQSGRVVAQRTVGAGTTRTLVVPVASYSADEALTATLHRYDAATGRVGEAYSVERTVVAVPVATR